MSKKLTISLILNVIFIFTLCFLIYRKGGINYVQSKLSTEKKAPEKPGWYYKTNPYWLDKKKQFQLLPSDTNDIIFIGDSHVDGCEWSELFQNNAIKNRGIEGDNTEGILERISDITRSKPLKVFIQIGSNDILFHYSTSQILKNYMLILEKLNAETPNTKVYIQSVIPTLNDLSRDKDSIISLNSGLKNLAKQRNLIYVDLFSELISTNGQLNKSYTNDGVHLNDKGYLVWKKQLEKFIEE